MKPKSKQLNKPKTGVFKKVNNWLHLWLGLISGVIVFIVCITGCIWVFNEEIMEILEPSPKIAFENRPVLSPGALEEIAKSQYPSLQLANVNIQQGKAIVLNLRKPGKFKKGDRGGGVELNIHPYNGSILEEKVIKKGETDFFRFILNGHRALWLPYDIGRPIVNYATLVFVVLLITGLIWWYPKKWSKANRDKSFKIKWGSSFKRLNIDLHNVLGFYAMLFLLVIALTGMVFGVKWYSESLYWISTGGEKISEFRRLQSDTTFQNTNSPIEKMEVIWDKVISENPKAMGFFYNFPDTKNAASTINVTVYPTAGQFYNSHSYTFDQNRLELIPRNDPYAIKYEQAGFGQKLRKMNYEIHIGTILGLPGKIAAFFASLIGASLPITGFLAWWGKRNKKPKTRRSMVPVKPRKELEETFA